MRLFVLLCLWLASIAGAYWFGVQHPQAVSSFIPQGALSSMPSSPDPLSAPSVGGGVTLHEAFPDWAHEESISSGQAREILTEIVEESDPVEHDWQFALLLKKLTPENSWGAWDVIKGHTDTVRNARRVSLFGHAWGKLDGESAMTAMLRGNDEWAKEMGIAACEGWGLTGAQEAAEWLEANSKAVSSNMRLAFLRGLAKNSPEQASAYLESLSDSPSPGLYVEAVAAAQLRDGFDQAETWVKGLTNAKFRKSGLSHLAKDYIDRDLEGAAEWGLTHADDPAAAEAVSHIAEAMLRDSLKAQPDDLHGAMNWVASLPEGEVKNVAYAKCLREWSEKTPNDAAEYLSQLKPSPAKDHALRSFALEVLTVDPEAAVHWAATIDAEDRRAKTLLAAARHWLKVDPGEANRWLDEGQIPKDLLEAIRPSN